MVCSCAQRTDKHASCICLQLLWPARRQLALIWQCHPWQPSILYTIELVPSLGSLNMLLGYRLHTLSASLRAGVRSTIIGLARKRSLSMRLSSVALPLAPPPPVHAQSRLPECAQWTVVARERALQTLDWYIRRAVCAVLWKSQTPCN